MNRSEPVIDKEKLKMVGAYLKAKGDKYYILFLLGLQSGMMEKDILGLTLGDVRHFDSLQRHGQMAKGYLSRDTLERIYEYAADYGLSDADYLIPSLKPDRNGRPRPLSRSSAFRVVREAGKACGLPELTMQALRKTYGYHYYTRNPDIVALTKIFGTKNADVTWKFIQPKEAGMAGEAGRQDAAFLEEFSFV